MLRDGEGRLFQALALIRIACGPSFMTLPEGVTKRQANALIKAKWLRKDKVTKRYYQVATDELFTFIQGQDRVFIPAEWGRMKDGDAILYHIMVGNYTKMHNTAAVPKQEGRKSHENTPPHPRSEHLGGQAHSEVKRITGMSLGKSHYLRRRCEALGLGEFTQRFLQTSHDSAFHGKVIEGDRRHLFDGYRRPMARLTSMYTPIMGIEFSHVPHWREDRYKTTRAHTGREIENFCSGETLAQYG